LLSQNLVSNADLDRAESVAEQMGMRLPAVLTRLGLVADSQLAELMAERHGLTQCHRTELPTERFWADEINERFLVRHWLVPVGWDGQQLVVATADPDDEEGVAGLRFATGQAIDLRVATFADIEEVLLRLSSNKTEPLADEFLSLSATGDESADDLDRLSDAASEAPVIRLVNRLITTAVRRHASDIHVEPMARQLVIRIRIDGRLVILEQLSDRLAAPLASRIKVMAKLDIAETRLPQDGRVRLAVSGRDIDIRVATTPTAYGESIVLRLLGQPNVPLDLTQLGLAPQALATLEAALSRPNGIILLTGPTGSGKTTTLYAALNRLRRPDIKILTVEDPVEILIEGINQVQVRPDIGLSYARTLRAFLRQDPDILMIGEIRDAETAEIAMRAALTGHLVLSTLHTNSAMGAFTRLIDMGLEPYLVASTIICTAAQRLVGRLCPQCRHRRPLDASELGLFQAEELTPPDHVYDACGCAQCDQTGYRGRVLVIEAIHVSDELRTGVRERLPETDLLRTCDCPNLRHNALMLVANGVTSFDEALRAVDLDLP